MRRREISPEFWTDDRVVELSDAAKLLFIGLWNLADREGRLEDRPKTIGFKLRPWAPLEAADLLAELASAGLVRRYEVEGAKLLCIPRFLDHQNPHPKEMASKLPAPTLSTQKPKTVAHEVILDRGQSTTPPTPAVGAEFVTDQNNTRNVITRLAVESSTISPFPSGSSGSSFPSGSAGPYGTAETSGQAPPLDMPAQAPPAPPRAAAQPKSPSTADGFWSHAQDRRERATGLIREEPPRGLSFWFSEAMSHVGGDEQRLLAGYEAFLVDPFWRNEAKARCAWAGWVKQWRQFVPGTAPPVRLASKRGAPVPAEAVDWAQVSLGEVEL